MPSEYIVSCCSAVDLTQEELLKRNIEWAPFFYEIDGVEYRDDLWAEKSDEDFYQAMANGAVTKTSRLNTKQYHDYFEQFVAAGLDVIHVCFSSGLSGSIESALMAADELADQYPDRKVAIVDSLCASSGYGLLMESVADLRDRGFSFDELVAWIERNRLRVHHWFISTDLTYYVRGGRISAAAGLVGTALKICPLLNVDSEGKLAPQEKIRTKKRALAAMAQRMVDHADNGIEYSGKAFISHSASAEDAAALARKVEETFPNLDGPVRVYPIGPTIGSHTGPGSICLFFFGDAREG